MTYTPTLRHLSLLFTLPLGFFVGSVVTHLKQQGAALARSPFREGLDRGVEPDGEAVHRAALDQKKRNWKSGLAALSIYMLFLVVLFYGAERWPNTFSAAAIASHTLLMAWISRTVLSQLVGTSSTLLSRPNDGTLLQEISTPFTLPSAVLSLLSLTLFPITILFPNFLPSFTILSFATIVLFFQNSPFTIAKDAAVSLRWAFTLFLGIELLAASLCLGLVVAIKEGLFDAIGGWLEATFSDGSAVAVAEEVKEVVQLEPFLGTLILEGMTFLQPFVWFMTTGWLIAILYRLDVSILEEKTGNTLVGVEEYGRAPSSVTFAKGETGQKISLPPLRSAIKRHLQAAIASPPIYFITGTATFISLLAVSPFILAHFESPSVVNDDPQAFSIREAVELEMSSCLLAVVLSPWIMAVAIGLVAFLKGQGKIVWNYREVWGESKVAVGGGGEAEKLLGGEGEEKVDVKRDEAMVV